MPFLLILLGAAVVAVLLFPGTTLATAYVGGKPVPIEVKSIGDFGCTLRSDAADAWLAMKACALDSGCVLTPKGPNSAFRTHEQQADMVESRPTFAAALDHSPHQMGVAVDVDLTQAGEPLSWLQGSGPDFGWYPLPSGGAAKEPWHWEFHGAPTS